MPRWNSHVVVREELPGGTCVESLLKAVASTGRGTHWVEHDVRHGCMSCARGQLWRDEGSLRQTTARLLGRRRRADACR
eukprot:2348466-Prymnesium_polylepis.1